MIKLIATLFVNRLVARRNTYAERLILATLEDREARCEARRWM